MRNPGRAAAADDLARWRYHCLVRDLVLIAGVCAGAAGCGSTKSAPPEAKTAGIDRDAALTQPASGSASSHGSTTSHPSESDADRRRPASAIAQLPAIDFAAPYRAAPGDAAAARALVERARAAKDAGEAIRLLTEAVAADPSDGRTRYALASRYAAAGDPRALALLAELTFARCDGCA